MKRGLKMNRKFFTGGIVELGNIELKTWPTCGYCFRKCSDEMITMEESSSGFFVCDSCVKKYFPEVHKGRLEEQAKKEEEAMKVLGITKRELDNIRLEQYEQTLFSCGGE
jgi:MinD superfamily P-loop ATPase